MAKYWADHAAELVAAEADRIKNLTADEIAEEYDERRVQRLLQNFAENPTAPVDLQLAMVDEPFEVRNQVSLAAAQADQGMPDDEGSLWSRGRSLLGRGFDAAYDGIKSQSRTVAPILEYQPQMLQAGFRTLVGAAEDPDELRGLALRSGLQVLGGGSPVPGASLADPNANLLKDLTSDRGALADRLESAQDYGEPPPST